MVVVLSSSSNNKTSLSAKSSNNAETMMACKSARLLLLGDKQVGKSASIVRYTTGRFIQEYSSAASNDWLYYRLVATENQTSNVKQQQQQQQQQQYHRHHLPSQLIVELLEQKDIQFSNSGNFFAPTAATLAAATTTPTTTINGNGNDNNKQQQSLSSRVALDQLIDHEVHEKQQMLERLRWADAYIVMYSISDIQSFQKAIKYLNLIANNINFPISADPSAHSKTSPPPSLLSVTNCNNTNNTSPSRRPILLLANKRDLDDSGRQVQTSDGRHLAIRHQSMFAEISVAQTGRNLEHLLYGLLESIEPASFHSTTSSNGQQKCPTNFEHLITSCTQQQQRQQPNRQHDEKSSSLTSSSYPLIGFWRARRRSSEQHCHQIVNSKIRQASLAKSQPVSANSVVQNCKLLVGSIGGGSGQTGSNLLESQQQATTITSALCTAVPSKVKSNSLESIGHQPQKQQQQQQSMNGNDGNKAQPSGRYENFKSSFKKASMAIVGSRALSKKSPLEPVDLKTGNIVDAALPAPTSSSSSSSSVAVEAGSSLKKSTLSSSPLGDFSSSSATKESLKQQQQRRGNLTNQPSSSSSTGSVSLSAGSMSSSTAWLRNHVRLNRGGIKTATTTVPTLASKKSTSSSDPKLTDSINVQHTILDLPSTNSTNITAHLISNGTFSDRIKRPLLRYKNRRKTVSFEQMNQEAVAAAATLAAEVSDESRRHTYHNDMGYGRRPSISRHSSLLLTTTIEEQLAGSIGDSIETCGSDGLHPNYNSARQSSGRSSCSLVSSTGDDNHHHHSSLLVLLQGVGSTAAASSNTDRAPSSVGSASVCSSSCSPNSSSRGSNHQLNKSMSTASNNLNCNTGGNANSGYNHSRSGTLSRGSTSAGEEMCVDDAVAARLPPAGTGDGDGRQVVVTCYPIQRAGSEVVDSNCIRQGVAKSAKLATVPSSTSLVCYESSSQATPKKRYQLVKSVQRTLTNLTRSSYVNNGQPAAKKSICTGLIRGSTSQNNANIKPLLLKSTQLVEPDLAKTEQVRHVMPMIVGYCK